jgi:pyridoxine 5'-phosphate synthase PdxJ
MTRLSVNINKVALLRNSRNIGIPSVKRAAFDRPRLVADALEMGFQNAVKAYLHVLEANR